MQVGDKRPRVLILVTGGVATGKTTLARALAERIGAVRFAGDEVHARLLAHDATTAERWEAFSPEFEERIYHELVASAEQALSEGRAVVLDSCFLTQRWRLSARACARRQGAALLLVESVIDATTQRSRLDARDLPGEAGSWQRLAAGCADRFEPIDDFSADEWTRVDGESAVEDLVEQLLARPGLVRYRNTRTASPELSEVRAVTFDCWNTLLYEGSWERAHALRVAELAAAARKSGLDVSPERVLSAFDRGWSEHIERWHSGAATGSNEVARAALGALGLASPDAQVVAELVEQFEEMSHSSQVLALEGALETLRGLRARGVRCGLICDTGLTPGRVIRKHLARLGLLAQLDVQVFSDEVRVPKPDPRAFRAALSGLDAAPESAVHVGDLKRTDVAGGRSIGMQTVRITERFDDGGALPEADFVVTSHEELCRLLVDR